MLKQKFPLLVPNFNHIYDSLRSQQAWRYSADNAAAGTFTTVAGATTPVLVTLLNKPNYRTSQWPGAVQVYLVIRSFSFAPQTATFATPGALDINFVDKSGNLVPVGDFISNQSANIGFDTLLPVPITDPGEQNVGTLNVALNAGATVGTYNWQLGFSYAYLIPAAEGYKVEHHHSIAEGHA
jgi:hypothetical protein